MRETICGNFCAYFKPRKDEPEKCLAFELLTAWSTWRPELTGVLADSARPGRQAAPNWLEVPKQLICSLCVFRRHGCDFAAGLVEAPPCGGLLALAQLLAAGAITADEVQAAWEGFLATGYLRLAEHASLRYLESSHLYDREADELYEVNDEGFAWLTRCDGTTPGLATLADREFLDFLLAEALLACTAAPCPRRMTWRRSPIPSLRYLELMLTERCNLRCRHCYLGEAGERELALEAVLAVLAEFQAMQGLRVLLSGGEPLLYSHWRRLNERLPEFELRLVLLSNGLLLTDAIIRELKVHEVQVSLDGLEAGHEVIRGPGTWTRTVARLQALQDQGLAVSVATMIHRSNLSELEEMAGWLAELGVREWNLDLPCIGGRLAENRVIGVDPAVGAKYLELGYGGSDHGATGDYACGRHLAAVLPDGSVAKCGLYADRPLGRLAEGLETCWLRLRHVPLTELDCAPCAFVHDCRGGCRFRAGQGLAPDPVMCALYGVEPKTFIHK